MQKMTERVATGQASRPSGEFYRDAAVSVRDVVKSFPVTLSVAAWARYRGAVPRRTVLHGISLDVQHGELFGLLGPNGAGKTTLLKMLATLCIADQGQILVDGVDAKKSPMAVKRKIGLCTSEERSFYFRLTARENLRFFGSLLGLFGRFLDARVEELVELVDLTSAIDRRFDTFSSGMRQRLSLARALLGNPKIVFFDEPTRAVDPLHARDIRAFIRDELVTRRGKTAILATNSLEEAWSICDTVAIVQNGKIFASGSPQTLDAQFTQCLRYQITLDGTFSELIEALNGTPNVRRVTHVNSDDGVSILNVDLDRGRDGVKHLLRTLSASGALLIDLKSMDPQPLEVFAGLTQNVDNS